MKKRYKSFLFIVLLFGIILIADKLVFKNKDLIKSVFNLVLDMCKRGTFEEAKRKIRTLKIGMTKDEVKSIMGDPVETETYIYKGLEEENWIFEHPQVSSEPPRCTFNKATVRVIEVVCGDDYRLMK